MSGDPNDLLKAREVAAILRREYRSALRLIGDKIPATHDGYRWLVRRRDLDAFIDANTQEARSSKQRRRGRGRRAA